MAACGARVLDAGAGTGMVGEELARLGFRRITALDLSPGMLKTANEKSVYEDLVVGELGKPLGFETGRFDAATCVGTLTIGHAPPESLDELVRVTKAGGAIVFSMRTDYLTEGGFDAKQAALEDAGRWRLLERGAPFQPMPHGEPDIWYEIWAYEVLPPPSPPRHEKTMLQLARAARRFTPRGSLGRIRSSIPASYIRTSQRKVAVQSP